MVNQGYQNYPMYYQNYPNYQQQPMQQPVIQQPQNQILAWVKDEKEAVDFPLSAGQSIFLMTQDDSYLYAKSVDQLGKTTFIKKRLIDETAPHEPKVDLTEYIKREEIENMIVDIIQKEIEKRISEISFKPTKSKKNVVVDDED
jgi:6-pyruvoyl-tetrahydropterin synthase